MMITLKTERLILRFYREDDLPEYHKLLSDRKNLYYLDDIATNTLEESLESLNAAIEANQQEKARLFCLTLPGTDQIIGAVGYEIDSITPIGKIAEPMGWFIRPEYQGKGYITEAAKRILAFAFLEDNCIRVATGCDQENLPSQKVMAKLGFRKEAEKIESYWHDGKMKTRLEFAINKNEFMKSSHQ
jgi:ribosomal-protein-alanine N-acetyltransferase